MANAKNPPATSVPTNDDKDNQLSSEELIKSNKSTMQQLLDVLAQNTELKEQLLDREARLMATQDAINMVLSQVNSDCNALYKEVNKNLVVLSDVVKGLIEPQLQQNFVAIRTQMQKQQKIMLSRKFREGEGLAQLDMSADNRLPPK